MECLYKKNYIRIFTKTKSRSAYLKDLNPDSNGVKTYIGIILEKKESSHQLLSLL